MKRIFQPIKRFKLVFLFAAYCFSLFACEEFVDIAPPQTEIVRETVFSSDETATAAMHGIYAEMRDANGSSMFSLWLPILTGLLSDQFVNNSTIQYYDEFSLNDIPPTSNEVFGVFWGQPYRLINNANSLLEGLNDNSNITKELRDHLKGEALFIRAYVHFYLTNFFGEVPYIRTTDIESNSSVPRESVSIVYDHIIGDLLTAQPLMYNNYGFLGSQRVRANRFAATALLARTYLYTEEWAQAELHATSVIDSDLYTLKQNLEDVFVTDSEEAILQLVTEDFDGAIRTALAGFFIITNTPGGNRFSGAASLSENAVSVFASEDNRRTNWIGPFTDGGETWYFPFKYKNARNNPGVPSEYTMLLRLAEQYLIRAEARAHQSNLNGALADLNAIRNRAGLPDTIANTSTAVLEAIALERRRELFAEDAHRWFDLKRTGRADAVLSLMKPTWQPTDVLLPIPELEILNNSNLEPQNPGY